MTRPYRNILEQIECASFRHDGETDRDEFADEYRADGLSVMQRNASKEHFTSAR
jgi:hypothetical protein